MTELSQPHAEIFVPDASPVDAALARTTHCAIGAHQDDIPIMAYHGIAATYRQPESWLLAVTMTDGAGSPRIGPYETTTDAEMVRIRHREERAAASIGEYGALALLNHPSLSIKDPSVTEPTGDIVDLLTASRPSIVYTHNPADRHDTHVAVALRTISAIRQLDPGKRPHTLIGCEVWRDLDWLNTDNRLALDVSPHPNLAAALLGVYDSQIAGGKRYDAATLGRRVANATFSESHAVDGPPEVTFAIDLTPLIDDHDLDPEDFITTLINSFRDDVASRLHRLTQPAT